MEVKFTPGPWFADSERAVWRRPPSELYQNGGGVAGDAPIAVVYDGHSSWANKYPAEANARLIAASPTMLEVLQRIYSFGDLNGEDYDAVRDVIAKATGGAE